MTLILNNLVNRLAILLYVAAGLFCNAAGTRRLFNQSLTIIDSRILIASSTPQAFSLSQLFSASPPLFAVHNRASKSGACDCSTVLFWLFASGAAEKLTVLLERTNTAALLHGCSQCTLRTSLAGAPRCPRGRRPQVRSSRCAASRLVSTRKHALLDRRDTRLGASRSCAGPWPAATQ